MTDLASFRDVIDLWPSKEAMAGDLGIESSWLVPKWRTRNSIPAEWWTAILSTSIAIKAGLTAADLAALAAREPAEARA